MNQAIETKRYNGWTNYETWNVKLWIDNEEGSQNYWNERAQEIYDATDEDADDRSRDARIALAEALKDEFEDAKPEVTGMWADLLGAALSEVDWFEIADAMLNDLDCGYKAAERAVNE